MPEIRTSIETALKAFSTTPLRGAGLDLLSTLGYHSSRTLDLGGSPEAFVEQFESGDRNFNADKALVLDWKRIELLFQLTGSDLAGQSDLFDENQVKQGNMQSYLFFALELTGDNYARGKLSQIARQINRLFSAPVMLLIKHREQKEEVLSIAVINRRPHKRDEDKDVLGKVTLIRNISLTVPHRGHLDILSDFVLPALEKSRKGRIDSFDALHAAWEEVFNVELLNKRFYRELANWYFWALPQVSFPEAGGENEEKRNATGLIRLLTRLIFCWFIKEKGLVPDELFDREELERTLTDLDEEASTYYCAILQNLFFATLNQRMGKNHKGEPYRRFALDEGFPKNKDTYGVDTLYRYEGLFRNPDTALGLFADVPFLNGGLFECLDRVDDDGKKIYIDGFSRNAKRRPVIPNRLFFASEQEVDLSGAYGEKKRNHEKARGLLHILHSYKFTIVENTPVDQEIALDPELLGKVFENLLASYNEETKTTARKQTGSFYTPRPIVDYMVDESLKAYLRKELCRRCPTVTEGDAKEGLEILFAYTEKEHAFSEEERIALIQAIDACKILDPACGSGAFPMGILHKLVFILAKLDPGNERWKQTQLAKLDSAPMREELERAFEENDDDYGRKLYLIENCLYGVDIQPIAIQISKLRFFISLVCDQKTNRDKAKNHGIRPLPNLETKFVAADTLIRLPEAEKQTELFVDPRVEAIEKEIESLYHSHFGLQRRDQKIAAQKKLKALRTELAEIYTDNLGFMSTAKSRHVAEWDPFNPQSVADFFDPHWMFGRKLAEGFDIVIGNPPYMGFRDMEKGMKKVLQSIYQTAKAKFDLYIPFIERGVELTVPEGHLVYICPTAFTKRDHGQGLRKFLSECTEVREFVDFEHTQIFSAATNYTCVLAVKSSPAPKNACMLYRSGLEGEPIKVPLATLNSSAWLLVSPVERDLINSIRKNTTYLGELADISEGIVTGLNKLYLQSTTTVDRQFSRSFFRPCLRGREIHRYRHDTCGEVVFYPYEHIDGHTVSVDEFSIQQKNPSFYSFIKEHKDVILSRGYFTKSSKVWYELWNQRKARNFEGLRILTPELSESNRFCIAEDGICYGDTVCGIKLKPEYDNPVTNRYLLGVLNSSLMEWYYKKTTVPKAGGFFIYKVMFLKNLPVRIPEHTLQERIAKEVEMCEQYVQDGKTAEIAQSEASIDKLVAEVYHIDISVLKEMNKS